MGQSCASSTGLYLLPPLTDPAITGDGGGSTANANANATSINDNPFAEHHWQPPGTAASTHVGSSIFSSSSASFRSGKTLPTATGGGANGGATSSVFSSVHHPHLPAWDLPTILIRETAIGDTSWPLPPYVTELLQRLSPLEVQFFLVRLLLPGLSNALSV